MTAPQIPELELSSVSELAVLVEKYGETFDLLYRGQSAVHKDLKTTIERLKQNNWDKQNRLRYETEVLGLNLQSRPNENEFGKLPHFEAQTMRDYQRRVRHYLADLPDPEDYFSWFALMQHYGAPTRLLDVTKSIFVALYFATSHADEQDGMIYSMFTPDFLYQRHSFGNENIKSIIKSSEGIAEYRVRQVAVANAVIELDNWNLRSSRNPAETVREGSGRGLFEIENNRPTKREIAQQGRFVMPLSLSTSFEDNMFDFYSAIVPNPSWKLPSMELKKLSFQDYEQCPVIKFRIARKNFRKIQIALAHMNITAESLFPDFEGLNKSMREKIERWKEIYPS